MCRLKMLLPQSEVQDTKQPSELKLPLPTATTSLMAANRGNHSRKRGRETEERCKIEDCDSDSCDGGSSDDTIDEFVSSEDISQQRKNPKSFAKSTTENAAVLGAKHLGLPSMLSIQYSSAIGRPSMRKTVAENEGELKCYIDETGSARSSGSVTVGSLQQMSLELSEEELSLKDKTANFCVADAGHGTRVKKQSNVENEVIKLEKSDKIEAGNDKTDLLQQPSLDLSLEDGSTSRRPTGLGKRESDELMRPSERGSGQLPSDGEEWHLMFDGSSEENSNCSLREKKAMDYKTENMHMKAADDQPSERSTPNVDNAMVTPPTKRRKTSKERKKTSRSRKKKSHHHRHHRNHRDHSDHKDGREIRTDLLTPVERDTTTSATPRKLFHSDNSSDKKENPKERKRSGESKAERDLKNVKEANVVIDLTQDDEITQTKTVITGSTKVDEDVQKGESPPQGQPRPYPNIKNTDHQFRPLIPILEPNLEEAEADSDITFCEEGSEHYSILGSPCYLPPTPGRENVSSILKRKSIAFSE